MGITEGLSLVIPWAIFLGGLAQMLGCIGDFKRNNIFEQLHLELTHFFGGLLLHLG